jgi:2-polyprenyl-3-methyl-5-hydroxy-6-metoxy-1,4-benzoquinol methylase
MADVDSESGTGRGAKFDAYAENYEQLNEKSQRASGEPPGYFAEYKLRCIDRLVGSGYDEPILDYGCGVGALTERLATRFSRTAGYDPSADSVERARARVPAGTFYVHTEEIPDGHFGVVVLANVLHHVPPLDRPALIQLVMKKLQPGSGRLVVFEHNPLNPLTRRAVAACEFDDDAILLWPRELPKLLRDNGASRAQRDFIVFFPRVLAPLRWSEPYLSWLPLGAQMMVVGTAAV